MTVISNAEVASVIYAILKKSDLIVVEELQAGFNDNSDNHVEVFKIWLNNLEDMHEKAEKFEEVENGMNWINDYVEEIDSLLGQIRNYTDV